MQKVGDRAAWGTAMFLTSGDGNATIDKPIKTGMNTIIPALRTRAFDTSTPLAETLYVAMQYFKQQNPEMTGFPSTATSPFNNVRDPYFDVTGTVQEACAQGFVLLLTDGMSTNDQQIPAYLKNYSGLGTPSFPSNGTTYARDVAFYMNTQDLRSSSIGKDKLPGYQNLRLYVIYTLGNDDDARDLLKDAAKLGGFKENCTPTANKTCPSPWPYPGMQTEWDKNNDGIPDTYFEAKNGEELESRLMNAILEMVKEAGSGTAVSVLATKGEGEGTLVQAIFEPSRVTNSGDVNWLGYLHSLWVDDAGQIREDTVNDYKLDTKRGQTHCFRQRTGL